VVRRRYLDEISKAFKVLFPVGKDEDSNVFMKALNRDIQDAPPTLKYKVVVNGKEKDVLVKVLNADVLQMLEKLTYGT
jgi:hypothetical protein